MDLVRTSEPVTSRIDLLQVAAAGVLWGTGGLAGALLDRAAGLSPIAVAAYRLVVGGVLLLALLAATSRLRGVRRDGVAARRLAAIGALAALYQSCYFASVSLTSVSLATLGTAPVLVVAADAALNRHRPGRRLLAAIALALAGLTLLVGAPGADQAPATLLGGCLLALASATGFAAITLIGRRPVPGLGPSQTTGFGFTFGGLLLLIPAAPAGLSFAPDPSSIALVAYLGLAPTALAYVLYFGGLRTVRAGSAAIIALLEPLTAAVLGALVLGDRLGAVGILGAVLIGIGVLACRRG